MFQSPSEKVIRRRLVIPDGDRHQSSESCNSKCKEALLSGKWYHYVMVELILSICFHQFKGKVPCLQVTQSLFKGIYLPQFLNYIARHRVPA